MFTNKNHIKECSTLWCPGAEAIPNWPISAPQLTIFNTVTVVFLSSASLAPGLHSAYPSCDFGTEEYLIFFLLCAFQYWSNMLCRYILIQTTPIKIEREREKKNYLP